MDAECEAWARQCLDGLGLEVPVRLSLVKRRAWSTVWRIETAGPAYYLKAAAPGFDVEPPLLPAALHMASHSGGRAGCCRAAARLVDDAGCGPAAPRRFCCRS